MSKPHAGRIGQRVGAYVLERLIGRGGMSVVFFARHEGTGRGAAVKILQTGLPENIIAARRLEQEARTIARIDNPHVVRMYDAGRTHDGLPWFAMEYLEGESLGRVFARHGRLPVPRMLDIVRQMLAGLSQAHALEIVHRDLKPDNVFLVRRDDGADFVKMLDFGIAKLLAPEPNKVESVAGVVLGTPEYLSPEVAMDVDVSPASDIYALGVVMFEGLTGRLPFTGRTPTAIAEQHCFDPPPRPRSIAPDLPVAVEEIILRCLAKEPGERYRDAASLDAALKRLQSSTSPLPRIERPSGEPDAPATEPIEAIEERLRRFAERHAGARALLATPLEETRRLRRDIDALEGERAELARQLDGSDDQLAALERELTSAMAESTALAEDVARLRGSLRSLGRLDPDDDAVALLGLLDPRRPPAGQRLAHLQRLDGQAPAIEQHEERRADLIDRIADAVERRARIDARCARLEADLILGRAAESGRRARLGAQLEALQARIETLGQRRARIVVRLLLRTRR